MGLVKMNCVALGTQVAEIIKPLSAKMVKDINNVVGKSAPDVELCAVCLLAATAFAKICEATAENCSHQIIDAMEDRLRRLCCPRLCDRRGFDIELKMHYEQCLTAMFRPLTQAGPLYDICKHFLWFAYQINTLDMILMWRAGPTIGAHMAGLQEGIDLLIAELKQ